MPSDHERSRFHLLNMSNHRVAWRPSVHPSPYPRRHCHCVQNLSSMSRLRAREEENLVWVICDFYCWGEVGRNTSVCASWFILSLTCTDGYKWCIYLARRFLTCIFHSLVGVPFRFCSVRCSFKTILRSWPPGFGRFVWSSASRLERPLREQPPGATKPRTVKRYNLKYRLAITSTKISRCKIQLGMVCGTALNLPLGKSLFV